MSLLPVLLIAWGVLTAILIVLLIYRSTLNMHADEQLFLDDASSHMAQEQMDVVKKMSKVGPWVRTFGAASGALILVIASIWVYHSLTVVQ